MMLLVTGFDPFGDLEANPASEAGAWLARQRPGVEFAQVPTSYARSQVALDGMVRRHRPDTVLLLGYAARAVGLRVERQARNAVTASAPDNDGAVRSGTIAARLPPALPSTAGAGAVLDLLAGAGIATTDSDDAGGYVCNWLYWHALCRYGDRPVLFVHLSAFTPENARGLTLVADRLIDLAAGSSEHHGAGHG